MDKMRCGERRLNARSRQREVKDARGSGLVRGFGEQFQRGRIRHPVHELAAGWNPGA